MDGTETGRDSVSRDDRFSRARTTLRGIADNMEKAIIGKREAVELTVFAMASGCHVLIEDVPGVGKTNLACALARSVDCGFKRIQCTPDILPADITGFSVFNAKTGEFEFRPGPVMSNFVLADEINRTTPKTQASLLEIMEEGKVTADGKTYPLPQPFMVLATQNPVEYQGTYPLPEAEIDRFAIRVALGYPQKEDELKILLSGGSLNPAEDLSPAASAADVLAAKAAVGEIHVSREVAEYLLAIVSATRSSGQFSLGASPRASISLLRMAKPLALFRGRDYVSPDDIKYLVPYVLCHRLILSREAKLAGSSSTGLVKKILEETPAPSLRK
jgi:MoxR-like ATPase